MFLDHQAKNYNFLRKQSLVKFAQKSKLNKIQGLKNLNNSSQTLPASFSHVIPLKTTFLNQQASTSRRQIYRRQRWKLLLTQKDLKIAVAWCFVVNCLKIFRKIKFLSCVPFEDLQGKFNYNFSLTPQYHVFCGIDVWNSTPGISMKNHFPNKYWQLTNSFVSVWKVERQRSAFSMSALKVM